MSSTSTPHTTALIPLTLSTLFERMSFYGVRNVLFLYMSTAFAYKWESHSETFKVYEYFTLLVAFMPLLGGLLADILMGNRLAIMLGGCVSGIGCLLLCIPHSNFFILGLMLIALGNGLHCPSVFGQTAILYRPRVQRMDAAICIVMTGTYIGSFFSPLFMSMFTEEKAYTLVFMIAGAFSFLSSVCMLPFSSSMKEMPFRANMLLPNSTKPKYSPVIILGLILGILGITFYWISLNTDGNRLLYSVIDRSTEQDRNSFYELQAKTEGILLVAGFMVLSIVWSFVRVSNLLKIGIGFFIYLGCILSLSMLVAAGDPMKHLPLLMLYLGCSAISEILLTSSVVSMICQYFPIRFNGLFIGLYMAFSRVMTIAFSKLSAHIPEDWMPILTIFFLLGIGVLAIVFVILFFLQRGIDQRAEKLPAA